MVGLTFWPVFESVAKDKGERGCSVRDSTPCDQRRSDGNLQYVSVCHRRGSYQAWRLKVEVRAVYEPEEKQRVRKIPILGVQAPRRWNHRPIYNWTENTCKVLQIWRLVWQYDSRPNCVWCKWYSTERASPLWIIWSYTGKSGGEVESEELFIGTLTDPRSAENSVWFSNLLIGGTTVKFKLDTGAGTNVLPLSVCSNLRNKSPLLETSVVLSSYGEFKVKPEGKLNLSCKVQGMEKTLPYFVIAVESPPI